MTGSGKVDSWPAVGTAPAGPFSPVIEIDRDVAWRPPEPRPWSTRTRLLAAGVAAAVAAIVYFAGIARPNSLAPVFQRPGTAEAMALDDSRAYVSGDNLVRAYQLSDGAVLWSRRVVGLANLFALTGDRVAVATVDVGQRPSVEVLDGRTGTVLWHRQTRLVGRAGDVLVVSGPGDGASMPLRGLDAASGSPLWTVEMEPTVMVAGVGGVLGTDRVEVLPGRLRVRDLTSGRVVVDVRQHDDTPTTSATVVGGTAVLVDQRGMISAYDAGDGHWLWRQPNPVYGIFSAFGDCGRYLCHVNDRGTIALDRATGRQAWKTDKRYLTAPVDDQHMFVAETFEGFDGTGTAVVDPRNGQVRTATAPWRGLGVIEDAALLVWRYDGPRQQLIGLFDAVSERTRIIGRATDWTAPPACVTSARHVLCANTFDIAVWSR